MKITNIRTKIVKLPLDNPIKTAIHQIDSVGCVLVYVETDEQHTGQGFLFTINGNRIKAFDEMVKGFAHFLVGKNPFFVEGIWQSIWDEINPTGHKGVTIAALSALDTACWDVIGKSMQKPLYQILGGCRTRIKTYASGGLWLSESIDTLTQTAHDFIEQGFHSIKIRVGQPDIKTDLDRVKSLRQAVGDNIDILADANQAYDTKTAIQLAKGLADYNVKWLEEPVSADDLRGHAIVTQQSPIAISSGETEYSRFGMQAMLEHHSCDILMPDLQRVGGISEMKKSAALASARHIPISTHFFTEYSLSIAGSASNCLSVEHIPWFQALFNESIVIDAGELLIPDRPGTGFTFNETIIAQHQIS